MEFYNRPFSEWELRDALSMCKDTSPGPDNIHNQMLKHLSEESLHSILDVFNCIWLSGEFPSQWREGIIVPILKPGKEPKDPNSYIPICPTSGLCKLLERMVNRRLVWLLESRGLLSEIQSGFHTFRSTTDHLVRLEGTIQDAFIRKQDRKSVV